MTEEAMWNICSGSARLGHSSCAMSGTCLQHAACCAGAYMASCQGNQQAYKVGPTTGSQAASGPAHAATGISTSGRSKLWRGFCCKNRFLGHVVGPSITTLVSSLPPDAGRTQYCPKPKSDVKELQRAVQQLVVVPPHVVEPPRMLHCQGSRHRSPRSPVSCARPQEVCFEALPHKAGFRVEVLGFRLLT